MQHSSRPLAVWPFTADIPLSAVMSSPVLSDLLKIAPVSHGDPAARDAFSTPTLTTRSWAGCLNILLQWLRQRTARERVSPRTSTHEEETSPQQNYVTCSEVIIRVWRRGVLFNVLLLASSLHSTPAYPPHPSPPPPPPPRSRTIYISTHLHDTLSTLPFS